MARFFIDRPIFAWVIAIIIMLAGAIAIRKLPIEQYPDIAPPTIVVRAAYPGADAETVAATVATPIEEQVKYSNEWARSNRELLFNKSLAGIATAIQDYAQHKAEKGEPVPDLLSQPLTRVRP